MYELEFAHGRILAVRIESCDTVEEAQQLAVEIRDGLKSSPGPWLAAADFRYARLFPPDVTNTIIAILRSDNPLVERSAHVLPLSSAVFALQIERMVREAHNPARRVFRDATGSLAYLAELLTPAQTGWLREWYDRAKPVA